MRTKNKHSANDHSHPYMRIYFWLDPANQYWERPGYSEWGRNYMRERVKAWQMNERSLTKVDGKISNQC